jgi:hypothetical protein
MTSREYEAGRELDALVATKIMGIAPIPWGDETPCPVCLEPMRYCGARSRCSRCSEWRYGPYLEYSSDIAAAWEVVEKMVETGRLHLDRLGFDGEEWRCWMSPDAEGATYFVGQAETAPLAICLVALKAVEAL